MLMGSLFLLAACTAAPPQPSDSLVRLYESGRTFSDFLAAARSRRETWLANYAAARVEPEQLERARRVPGHWRLLVVAEDWCGDSANSIPFVAGLVDSLANVELRVVDSKAGRWVMEANRTPDGRAATPTVVLLDAEGQVAGCFVERSRALQAWVKEERSRAPDGWVERKYAWYREDAGRSTVADIVLMLESAAAGTPLCPRQQD